MDNDKAVNACKTLEFLCCFYFEHVPEVLDEIFLFIQNIKFHRVVHFENYSKNCGKVHRKTITPKSFANKFDKTNNFP